MMVHTRIRRVLVGAAMAGAVLVPVAAQATVTNPAGSTRGPFCNDQVNVVSWQPSTVAGLTGYQIETWFGNKTSRIRVYSALVGPTVSSAPVGFSKNAAPYEIIVTAMTTTGSGPVVSDDLVQVNLLPLLMGWYSQGGKVGDRTATPQFWYGLNIPTNTGVATITIRPGGTVKTVSRWSDTFTGLTNGVAYTFEGRNTNICGTVGPSVTGTFTPGIGPAWTANTPPLTAHRSYAYRFVASGKPAPSFTLLSAPSWLSVNRHGLVSGKAPARTTTFSYSVVAHNGVGISGQLPSDVTAGPFTVAVR